MTLTIQAKREGKQSDTEGRRGEWLGGRGQGRGVGGSIYSVKERLNVRGAQNKYE